MSLALPNGCAKTPQVMRDFTDVMKMDLEPRGVMVQASTLGALEALMQFLRKECDPPIPVFAVGIGPIFKKDVMRAGIMNEKVHDFVLCFLRSLKLMQKNVRENFRGASCRPFVHHIRKLDQHGVYYRSEHPRKSSYAWMGNTLSAISGQSIERNTVTLFGTQHNKDLDQHAMKAPVRHFAYHSCEPCC